MEGYKEDSEKRGSDSSRIRELCGCSEEELLKEFELASRLKDFVVPKGSDEEAEIIWNRILGERSGDNRDNKPGKVVRGRFRWKKVVAAALVACMLVCSGCLVAMGTKSYFFREIEMGKERVLVNDSCKMEVNGEEDAYRKIECELGIQPLMMSYIPENMQFESLEIKDGYAFMVFDYLGGTVGLTQAKFDKAVSYKHKSDSENDRVVFNRWLNDQFIIKQEALANGLVRYETSIVIDGGYYRLYATMEEDEFVKIVERLSF